MRRVWSSAAAVVVLLVLTVSSFSWDNVGHEISAYIAWQRMAPEVRERVVKILLDAAEDSDIPTFYVSYGSQSEEARKRQYFMMIATWADVVRDRTFEVRYRKYHKSNWHYSDSFWTIKDGKIESLPPPGDGGKALEKLSEYSDLLTSSATASQKAVAIAWIEHIIGDLHQPLHTSARVTETESKGDQGGNLFLLTPQGTPRNAQKNLHSFWDSIVVHSIPNSDDLCDSTYVEPIARKILKKYPYEKLQARLAAGKFADWTAESLKISQTEVFSADLVRFREPSDKYRKKALKISEERLALAGYRMAELFNAAFAAK
ncbi:MAG: S1/P1 nuclease [Chloracidobacterium sp.]|nr:S1/P1 nuclease [Chloracidobacterium sp.]